MYCGFDITPTSNGVALISVGGRGTIFKVYVPRAGPQMFRFPRGLYELASRGFPMLANCGSGGLGRRRVSNLTYH
jgi:hypothetical protein